VTGPSHIERPGTFASFWQMWADAILLSSQRTLPSLLILHFVIDAVAQ